MSFTSVVEFAALAACGRRLAVRYGCYMTPVEILPAVTAGFGAAVITTALRWIGRRAGWIQLDSLALWRNSMPRPRMAALLAPLAGGAVLGIAYAWGLHQLGESPASVAVVGIVGGVLQYVVVGFSLAFARPPDDQRPGVFARDLGPIDVLGLLAGQLAFGLIATALYVLFARL